MAYQAAGNGHYSTKVMDPNLSGCYKCHTGEGYLKSKDATIAGRLHADRRQRRQDGPGVRHVPQRPSHGCRRRQRRASARQGRQAQRHRPDRGQHQHLRGLPQLADRSHGCLAQAGAYGHLAAHGSPSHPQREMLHGGANDQCKVMLDTASAGQFMPGAKCEDCHMPKTNKTANRISHGMKPMLPGDAETWMTEGRCGLPGRGLLLQLPRRRDAQRAPGRHRRVAERRHRQGRRRRRAIKAAKTQARVLHRRHQARLHPRRTGHVELQGVRERRLRGRPQPDLHRGRPRQGRADGQVRRRQVRSHRRHGGRPQGQDAHVAGLVVNGNGSGATGATVSLLRGTKVIATTRPTPAGTSRSR